MSKRRRNMVPGGRAYDPVETSSSKPGGLIELGRIVNRHGIQGEVRVLPHNPGSRVVLDLRLVAVTRGDDPSVTHYRVLNIRRHKRFALLRLEGVTTANDAEALIGCGVAIPRADLPPAGPAAAYHVDLIGCAVRTTAGDALGTVEDVIITGSADVCVVRGAGREVLIPLVNDVIAALDTDARTILVHPVPGLIEP